MDLTITPAIGWRLTMIPHRVNRLFQVSLRFVQEQVRCRMRVGFNQLFAVSGCCLAGVPKGDFLFLSDSIWARMRK